jgi:DNA polymerase
MKLTPLFLDFETFWSTTHSLSKMNPITYVMHPDTEIISLAYKFNDEETHVIFGEKEIQAWCDAVDWEDKLVVAHNNIGFDSMILAWRFGVRPKMWGCTLAMSRPFHGLDVGGSLAALMKHYGLGTKDTTALLSTKGRHLIDFTPGEVSAMRIYNRQDTDGCASLFRKFLPDTPKREMKLIDMTIRMLVEPKFDVDKELLLTTLGQEKHRKRETMLKLATRLGWEPLEEDEYPEHGRAEEYVRKILASALKFAAFLKELNVECPVKESPTNPGTMIPALAKSDAEFIALTTHPNALVAEAARARLDIKSTILETRIESFLEVTECMKGKMPIAKNYYGGHTGRWSGAMALNQENLPRIDKKMPKPSDALRGSLLAPKGYKVVVADLSGIELRVNHFLWKVPSSMALFKADPENADLYTNFAGTFYEIAMEEVSREQRQVGKVAHLGLGFGAGHATFQTVAKNMAKIDLSVRDSQEIVNAWRDEYPEIVQGWKRCHKALSEIYQGALFGHLDEWGLCRISSDGIVTPRGVVRYPNLHQETDLAGQSEWWYGEGRTRARIYAGKVTENVVQHLARNVLADNMLAIQKRYPIAHCVHDEVVLIVPDDEAEEALRFMQEIMRTPPTWWPELVVWSEGGISDTYGGAK